jgi:Xaa-Pro aminopeptidase
LENVALITPDAFVPQWLMFESLTLVPFDRSLVVPDLLCYAQRLWLDRYHKRINQTLSPLLTPAARQWLAHQTRPLETYAM